MSDTIHDLGSGFWNIRGSFKIGGVLNIGTQCSLVQLASNKFIFLDSYTLTGEVKDTVMHLTNDGQDVEAVLNLHPYHTVHCKQMAKDFANAVHYGSQRHHDKVPEIDWEADLVESEAVAKRYPELKFSLPQGIYYIAPNETVHAGSLLAYHPASHSLHVDDTFVTPPSMVKKVKFLNSLLPEIALHPTTKKALTDEADAGEQYCNWATQLADEWADTRHFCAAHSGITEFNQGEFTKALLAAINKARPKLGAS